MKHLPTFRFIEAVSRAGSIRKASGDMKHHGLCPETVAIQRFERGSFGVEFLETLTARLSV